MAAADLCSHNVPLVIKAKKIVDVNQSPAD